MTANSSTAPDSATQPTTIRVLLMPDNEAHPVRIESVEPTDGWMNTLLRAGTLGGIWGPGWTAWCDDNGMSRQLPVNFRATRFLEQLGHPSDLLFGSPGAVLGPVVLCDEDEDGEWTGVSDDVIHAATALGMLTRKRC